eukprot:Gregarina_sp_Poly_1__304@NODE_1075_length_5172_cov_40_719491_g538_i1_p1_GENE_NODE_1075_length_5172_cov_40_719491_g538_i1NODE_1075_length_5172_cov_40_719491_g538_i1_p1_ORF_typecomplete_len315_score41_76_NODE_1075_length_5172_cov_40_719491_g538_i135224466
MGEQGVQFTTKPIFCKKQSHNALEGCENNGEWRARAEELESLSLCVSVWRQTGWMSYVVTGSTRVIPENIANGDVSQSFLIPHDKGLANTPVEGDSQEHQYSKIHCDITIQEVFDFEIVVATVECEGLRGSGREFKLTCELENKSAGYFPFAAGYWSTASKFSNIGRLLEGDDVLRLERPGSLIWRGVNSRFVDQTLVFVLKSRISPVSAWKFVGRCATTASPLLLRGRHEVSESLLNAEIEPVARISAVILLHNSSQFRQTGLEHLEKRHDSADLVVKVVNIVGLPMSSASFYTVEVSTTEMASDCPQKNWVT